MATDLVAAVLQARDAFLPVAEQPRVHLLAADSIPSGGVSPAATRIVLAHATNGGGHW